MVGTISARPDRPRELQRDKWRELADTWFESKPPAVPSTGDLEVFFDQLLKVDAQDVVLLGCTPTIRDIVGCLPHLRRLLVVDFVKEMYAASVLRVPLIREERYISADWLNTELGSGSVDAIVGDKSLDNVALDEWPQFFTEMRRVLRDSGVLILHVGLTPPESKTADPSELILRWSTALVERNISLADATAGLWEDLLCASSQADSGLLSIQYWMPQIEMWLAVDHPDPLQQAGRQLATDLLATFRPSLTQTWTDMRLEDIIAASSAYFYAPTAHSAVDYDAASSQPTLAFKPR